MILQILFYVIFYICIKFIDGFPMVFKDIIYMPFGWQQSSFNFLLDFCWSDGSFLWQFHYNFNVGSSSYGCNYLWNLELPDCKVMLSTTGCPRVISPLISGSTLSFPFYTNFKNRKKRNSLRKKSP